MYITQIIPDIIFNTDKEIQSKQKDNIRKRGKFEVILERKIEQRKRHSKEKREEGD